MKEAQRGSGMFVGLCWAGLEYVDGRIEYDEVSGTASAGYTDNRASGLKAHADRLALTKPQLSWLSFSCLSWESARQKYRQPLSDT